MGAVKTQGIVLSSFVYGDNDQIVTIFSAKFGKLSFLAQGVNKLISKNKYSLLTFSLSEFEIFKSRTSETLSKLKTGVLVTDNLKISEIFDNYLYACACTGVVEEGSEVGQKNYQLFLNLSLLLKNLSQNKNPFLNFVYFLFFSLKFFGGFWQLNQCFRCQKRYQTYRLFSWKEYGLICPNCWQESDEVQDPDWIYFLKKLNSQTFLQIQTSNDFAPISYLIILGRLLLTYYQDVLGINNYSFTRILQKYIFKDEVYQNYTHSVLTR